MVGLNDRIVGKCGKCGGTVTLPKIWQGVQKPVPQCTTCGAVADTTQNLPVLPMIGGRALERGGTWK